MDDELMMNASDIYGSLAAAANLTDASNKTNITTASAYICRSDIPSAVERFQGQPIWAWSLLAIYLLCVVVTIGIYIEEIVFLGKHFRKGSSRLQKTAWILAFFPGFSLTGFFSVVVPRSGTLCDLISNVFYVTCLYQFIGLMESYMGGEENILKRMGSDRDVKMSTGPCCCCCLCLPRPKLTRSVYLKLKWMTIQATIVRPLLMFIAAVLWTDGNYVPGNMSLNNASIYIVVVNLISTLVAMWGLMILKTVFNPELEERFAINGKINCLQLSLFSISTINIIIGFLTSYDVIKCTSFTPSKGRADSIYHGIVVLLMCVYGLLARLYFRRAGDAKEDSTSQDSHLPSDCLMTKLESRNSDDKINI